MVRGKMKKSRIIYLIIGLVALTGCFKSTKGNLTETDYSQAFLVKSAIQDTYAFQLYKDSPKGETAKIRYIINLVRYSDWTFYRNRETFSGSVGARWLEYKLNRYAEDSKTVDDFINKTASFSRKSGKDYLVISPKGKRYPAKYVYLNELRRLRNFEKGLTESTKTIELAKEVLENEQVVERVLQNPKLTQKVLENENITREVLENDELAQKVLQNKKLVKEILQDEGSKPAKVVSKEVLPDVAEFEVYGPQFPADGAVAMMTPLSTIATIHSSDQLISDEKK